jgi:ketosteroid isomerase-like protein
MAHPNVELARALTELWNEGERDVPEDYLDPSVVLESPFSAVAGEPYRGHDGITRWAREIDEHFAQWHIDLEDVRPVGDAVIAFSRVHGRGRGSGIELDQPAAVVLDFGGDGRITRVRIYWDLAAARAAVGLTE